MGDEIILVKVVPNAPKNVIEGWHEGVLKVKIKAPPDKGKANEELISFLAHTLGIPKSHITLISGHSSRLKKIKIDGSIHLLKKKV